MDTQNLSLAANDSAPDLAGEDQECLTTATASEVIAWLVACRAAGTLHAIGACQAGPEFFTRRAVVGIAGAQQAARSVRVDKPMGALRGMKWQTQH